MIQPLNLPEPKARCSTMHPERGTQCGLPESHIGQHQNGTLCAPWSDILPTYIIDASDMAEGRAANAALVRISDELGKRAAATIEQIFQNQKDAAP